MSGRLLDLLKIRWLPVEVFWAVSALGVAALIVQAGERAPFVDG